MTANELADAMGIRASIRRQATSRKSVQEGANDRLADQLEQAATMLRQQADRINVLEANHKIQLNINDKALKYIKELEEQNHWLTSNPLKELSDEEIEYEWFNIFKPETGIGKNITNGIYDFARAILKRASEK